MQSALGSNDAALPPSLALPSAEENLDTYVPHSGRRGIVCVCSFGCCLDAVKSGLGAVRYVGLPVGPHVPRGGCSVGGHYSLEDRGQGAVQADRDPLLLQVR